MASQHVVVDGSNIATEGRSIPSLAQLEGAIAELRKEMPDAQLTVVVDATFAHRIDESELKRFESETLKGSYISPPAGAIGRGDAFLLRIAEKVDGIVLSNDSFQEFHGEHPWLFDRGRLIGASPVPGVGWIFMPRAPVRGQKSRVATRETRREQQKVARAIAEATKEAETDTSVPEASAKKRSGSDRTRRSEKPQAVNDPITFIGFIAEHHLGDEVTGDVDSFTSHGAVVIVKGVRCYAPLANLARPAPKSAREVLTRGEQRSFVITALDPYRRGVELSLPGLAEVSGKVSAETVAGELDLTRRASRTAKRPAPAKAPAKKAAKTSPVKVASDAKTAAKKLTPVKTSAKKAPAKQAPAKAQPAKQGATKKAAAAKVPALVSAPKKSPGKSAPAKKAATGTVAKKSAVKADASGPRKRPGGTRTSRSTRG